MEENNIDYFKKGKEGYNEMRLGCLVTLIILAISLIIYSNMDDEDKRYWFKDNDKSSSSVIDNPSRQ